MQNQLPKNAFRVPNSDSKLVQEHLEKVAKGHEYISIAHRVAPPDWIEPPQQSEFDEWTLVSSGKKMIDLDGKKIVLKAGQSMLVNKSTHVQYSNPFTEPCEYWSVLLPELALHLLHGEEEDEDYGV